MAEDAPQADEMQRTEAEGASDQDIIDDAKSYLEFCNSADNGNRAAMLDDLEFIAGDQWDSKAKRQRELDGRPCLTINKLPTFLHQVTNDQRENVSTIKVSPVDSNADPKTAQVIQGMVRHIEYSSNADTCYDTAVNGAAGPGVGYFGLLPAYCSPDSFDQELRFRRFRNAFTVWFDPASQEPDGSDAKRCLITEKRRTKELQQEYPDIEVTTDGIAPNGGVPGGQMSWIWDDFMLVAEYLRMEYEPDELIQLANGETGFKSDLIDDGGNEIVNSRPTMRQRLMWYKLTALQVLERTEIKCKWIPIFPVYGDEIDLDGKVVRQGLIRNAKDPARMYNMWMTSATEEVALRTKTPFIGAEGQFEGYEDDWNLANVKSFPYLEYKPIDLNGNIAPPPQRQPMTDVPVGYLAMCNHANDNIKATTGLFDSSLGARGSATSGVQERAQQRQGDLANFHYIDNRNKSIRQAGRCLVDMIPHYYDTQRVVRIMGEDGKLGFAEINKPTGEMIQRPGKNGQLETVERVLNDLSVGQYDVVISTGPAYSTLRQETAQNLVELGGKWPKLLDVAGDKVIGNMDFPEAQEIGERIKRTIPPAILGTEDDEEQAEPTVQTPAGPVSIEQASQMLLTLDQQMQEMQQALQDAQSGTEKAKIDAASREKVAQINAASKEDVEELKGFIQILLAKIQPPPALAADVAGDLAEEGSEQAPNQGRSAGATASPLPVSETTSPSVAPAPSGVQ